MCTVSVTRRRGGYNLWFNRDEQQDRAAALPPQKIPSPSGFLLAPRDPTGGGTWLALSKSGLCCCVLNQYPVDAPAPLDPLSRGLLPLLAAAHANAETAVAAVRKSDLSRYPAFLFLAVDLAGPVHTLFWDGRTISIDLHSLPLILSSSSINADRVVAARRQQWDGIDSNDARAVRDFHFSHRPKDPAASVLMSRPDARTVSVCHVAATHLGVDLKYYPVLPGQAVGCS